MSVNPIRDPGAWDWMILAGKPLPGIPVINGASDLFLKVFGEVGKHARAAVATNGLPRGTTVEVQVVVEVKG